MAHHMSGQLFEFTVECIDSAPTEKCEHLKKTKEVFYFVLGDKIMRCRACAISASEGCSSCGKKHVHMYFGYAYLRGATGNAPNYFLAPVCKECAEETPLGEWGVQCIMRASNDGELWFMNLKRFTIASFPEMFEKKPSKIDKTTKMEKMHVRSSFDLELA